MSSEPIGTFVKVWEDGGEAICIDAAYVHSLDAAVTQWLDTGRDSVVHVGLLCGDEYAVLASAITSWRVCTPAGRARDAALEERARQEDAAYRADAGAPWSDA